MTKSLSMFAQDVFSRREVVQKQATVPAEFAPELSPSALSQLEALLSTFGKLRVSNKRNRGLAIYLDPEARHPVRAESDRKRIFCGEVARCETLAGVTHLQRCPYFVAESGDVHVQIVWEWNAGHPLEARTWKLPRRPWHRIASSVPHLLEKVAVFLDVGDRLGSAASVVRIGKRVGAELAAKCKAEPMVRASDAVHTFWRLDDCLIHDGNLYGDGSKECWAWLHTRNHALLVELIRFANEVGAPSEVAWESFHWRHSREPEEAPAIDALGPLQTQRVQFGVDPEVSEGLLFVEERDQGPIVHQVRVHAKRVLSWDRYQPAGNETTHYAIATPHFWRHLSERALAWVRRYAVMHYPDLAASPDELRALLNEHGLGVTDKLLEAEAALGGLVIPNKAGYPPQAFGLGVHAEYLPRLTLSSVTSLVMSAPLTIEPTGVIWGGDEIDGKAPIASSWKKLLERRAIGYDGLCGFDSAIGDQGIGQGRYVLEFAEAIGPELGNALGIPEARLLSDRYNFFAESDETLVWSPLYCLEYDLIRGEPCTLATNNLDVVVDALHATQAMASGRQLVSIRGTEEEQVECGGPWAVPPALAVEQGMHAIQFESGAGTLRIFGGRGAYRIEQTYTLGSGRQCWRTLTAEQAVVRCFDL